MDKIHTMEYGVHIDQVLAAKANNRLYSLLCTDLTYFLMTDFYVFCRDEQFFLYNYYRCRKIDIIY